MSNICIYSYDPNILTQSKVNSQFSLIHKHLCYVEAKVAAGVVSGATDGLSVNTSSAAQLGQTVGAAGNPAILTESREIPMGGFNLSFTGGGIVSIGALPTISYPVTTTFSVTATSQLSSVYISGSISTLWTNHSGINSVFRDVSLGATEYGDLIEELTSVLLTANNWGGYVGMYSTPYVFGSSPFNPGAGPVSGYVGGFSSIPVYDNAGATTLPNLFGFHSALNANNGPVTAAKDLWCRELNSVSRVPNAPTVTNHYGVYMEPFTKATNNYGVYVNGVQISYFGGKVGIGSGVSAPTANLHLVAGTATAGTAPLKINAGTNLTTPENGAVEYDGTNLFITAAAARKTVVSSVAVTSSSTNTVTNKIQINIGGTTYFLLASTSGT